VPQPASTQFTVTSMLPCQPAYMPTRTPTLVGPPSRDDVVTSALPRPPIVPVDDVVTSALPRPPAVPGSGPFIDNAMQRPVDRVDNRNVEQLLAHLSLPPPVNTQPILPLLSDRTQTTANLYENTNIIPSLLAHGYADIPFDSNYQNVSANLSLPSLSTHINVPTHVNAPLSQAIAFGQSNVTQPSALYAASYASDLNSSTMVAFPPIVCTSYADNSQSLPIAVGQPGLSAFSRVDALQNRPIAVDPTVQYVVCTSASADNVWPTVTTHPAPVQSPSVHWRKQFAYEYIQPDTGLGAPTHAAPAVHYGYIRPQTSDTHTHTFNQCALAKRVIWRRSYND